MPITVDYQMWVIVQECFCHIVYSNCRQFQ